MNAFKKFKDQTIMQPQNIKGGKNAGARNKTKRRAKIKQRIR